MIDITAVAINNLEEKYCFAFSVVSILIKLKAPYWLLMLMLRVKMLFRPMICRLVDESLQMTKNICIAIIVDSCQCYELYYIHNGQIQTVRN